MFELLKKLPGWILQYGPKAESILAGLEEAAKLLSGSAKLTAPMLPSLSRIKDGLYLLETKNTLARKMGETGKISESDAHALIEADLAALSTASSEEINTALKVQLARLNGEKVEAGGQILAGIANWILKNGPTMAAEVVSMIQAFLPLIAAFAATGA